MAIGNFIDQLGTSLGLPEWGISERLAGGPTQNTAQQQPQNTTVINPTRVITRTISPNPAYKPPAPTYQPPAPTPTGDNGFNQMDRNANPGDGYFWDAADGWKQINPGGQPSLNMDAYFSALDEAMAGLGTQEQAQKSIIENQYQQALNTYGTQKEQGLRDLSSERTKTEASQNKTMKDLAESMRNQFMSGQVMLGARGAGDSSAANQYSYALTKLGNQQRGDVASQYAEIQNDIADREFKLKSTYDSEIRNIELEKNNMLNQVTQWLAEQQNQIRMMKAEGKANMAQAIYNQAIQEANRINTEASNRRNMLDQWALNNASSIKEAAAKMQNLGSYQATMPTIPRFNASVNTTSSPTTNRGIYGGGYYDEDAKFLA